MATPTFRTTTGILVLTPIASKRHSTRNPLHLLVLPSTEISIGRRIASRRFGLLASSPARIAGVRCLHLYRVEEAPLTTRLVIDPADLVAPRHHRVTLLDPCSSSPPSTQAPRRFLSTATNPRGSRWTDQIDPVPLA
ncbi:hypothetical protein Isop_1105 [Isosphaera pallida ATCC 43644]|uniref:Uncharacterized protein n=1 Tax=Isosphaera pallida (strain ATCC 43644 / DSM 9630 / IS1B) TaxID=575540 RepID=E8R4U7_ISOPI|nr:hypothetical protein Isop_1105 [Isosphaera pallida ATCC 43644]